MFVAQILKLHFSFMKVSQLKATFLRTALDADKKLHSLVYECLKVLIFSYPYL